MEGTAHNITDDTSNDEVPGSKRYFHLSSCIFIDLCE